MTEFTLHHPRTSATPYHRYIYACLAIILFCLSYAVPLYAAEPLEIVVRGIEGDALENVQKALAPPRGLVDENKIVNRLWLERYSKEAENNSRSALEPFGYYNSLITSRIEQREERYRLLVDVVPGEQAHLTAVKISLVGAGKGEKRLQRLITAFPLKNGDVLLQQRYEEAKGSLITTAVNLGYLDAKFTRHQILVARSGTAAAIELALESGEKYYFGATQIQGVPDFPDSFLRRYLTYQAGEQFSYSALSETQRNFSNSERFKTVLITPDKEVAEAYKVPIKVELQAAPRISVRPGIGYGTDTGARFTIRYRDLNMFHLGHELFSNLYVAERLQGLVTGYIIPSPRDVRSSTTLQLNLQQENTSIYDSRIVALELARNRSLGRGKLGTVYIKAQYEDYTVGTQQSTSRLLLPGVRYSDDRYNNPIRPRKGFRYAVDLHGTHQILGSDTALMQLQAEGSYLLPLPWRFSLHTRAKAGTTFLNDPLRDIPPSLRFFTGGDQSVRGYSYKSLGPRDAAGKVVGGTQLLVGSIELERALFKDWGVSLFYDAGNTFNSFSDVNLAQGAGIGLHYYTAVGALNLSVARPLGVDNPTIHFHFTVGFEL